MATYVYRTDSVVLLVVDEEHADQVTTHVLRLEPDAARALGQSLVANADKVEPRHERG